MYMPSSARNALTFGVNMVFRNNMKDLKTEARKYYVLLKRKLNQTLN